MLKKGYKIEKRFCRKGKSIYLCTRFEREAYDSWKTKHRQIFDLVRKIQKSAFIRIKESRKKVFKNLWDWQKVFNFAALSSKKRGVRWKREKGLFFGSETIVITKGVSIDKSGLGYNAHKHNKPTARSEDASKKSVIKQWW